MSSIFIKDLMKLTENEILLSLFRPFKGYTSGSMHSHHYPGHRRPREERFEKFFDTGDMRSGKPVILAEHY